MSKFIVKGQPWISPAVKDEFVPNKGNAADLVRNFKDRVLQDWIIFEDGKDCSTETKVIIEDIWENLLQAPSKNTYDWNKKSYFYWTIPVTDSTSPTGSTIEFKLECPKLTYQKARELLLGCGKPEFLMTDQEKADMYANEAEACAFGKFPFGDPRKKSLGKGAYLDYYITKFIEYHENAKKRGNIQKQEFTFPGSTYIDQNGNDVHIEATTVTNSDLSDVQSLLYMF